jgi:hypothetical protein
VEAGGEDHPFCKEFLIFHRVPVRGSQKDFARPPDATEKKYASVRNLLEARKSPDCASGDLSPKINIEDAAPDMPHHLMRPTSSMITFAAALSPSVRFIPPSY